MRKLASIQRVLAVEPIPGADVIVATRINGWQCVTKKGEFSPGDLGVFFEIDAIPPDEKAFQFLWTPKGEALGSVPRPERFRIRTMRLRGCLSQGLLMPLRVVGLPTDLDEGTDVTDQLGVGKYEPPLPSGATDIRGPFPAGVPRTEEMRIQSMPRIVEELNGLSYVVTLKCDGASATFLIDPDDGEFHACSRNYSIRQGAGGYWKVADALELEARIRSVDGRYALQGELCGPGVHKNRLGLDDLAWFVFDAYDLVEHRHLKHDERVALCEQLDLVSVPVIEEGEAFAHDQASLLELAEGRYPGTRNEREGLVVRSRQGITSPTLGKRLSFKVISNRYLLRQS
ncbi:MAG: RNA ligase (ATP) [Myxococcota bacterium]